MSYRRLWESWEYKDYIPSRPLPAKNGIRTKSQRGRIGETWWSGKWIRFLESLGMGARLERGKSYARLGQVLNLNIEPGLVTATVQGSRPKPYKVTIRLNPLSTEDWGKVLDAMASQAIFSARLLSGEMPQNIEEAFQAARVSLFPVKRKDLESNCSCPDWANPCKHVAAVYYLLAERFDSDPFIIFLLRGEGKEDLLAGLRQRRSVNDAVIASPIETEVQKPKMDEPSLEACLDHFWAAGPELSSFRVTIAAPEVKLAVLKRLGEPSFWDGKQDVITILSQAYEIASESALELAYDGGD